MGFDEFVKSMMASKETEGADLTRPNTQNTLADFLECTPMVGMKVAEARINAFCDGVQELRLKHKIPNVGVVMSVATTSEKNPQRFGELYYFDCWGQFFQVETLLLKAARQLQKMGE